MAGKASFHRLVPEDVQEGVRYYSRIDPNLAELFLNEFERAVEAASNNPNRYHPQGEFRRINLNRFPYHILYQIREQGIRVMVLRHNKRTPKYGATRA